MLCYAMLPQARCGLHTPSDEQLCVQVAELGENTLGHAHHGACCRCCCAAGLEDHLVAPSSQCRRRVIHGHIKVVGVEVPHLNVPNDTSEITVGATRTARRLMHIPACTPAEICRQV